MANGLEGSGNRKRGKQSMDAVECKGMKWWEKRKIKSQQCRRLKKKRIWWGWKHIHQTCPRAQSNKAVWDGSQWNNHSLGFSLPPLLCSKSGQILDTCVSEAWEGQQGVGVRAEVGGPAGLSSGCVGSGEQRDSKSGESWIRECPGKAAGLWG